MNYQTHNNQQHRTTTKAAKEKKPATFIVAHVQSVIPRICMSKDTKVSIILGIALGIIFLVSTFLSEVVGTAISILACVLFGPLTVWKIESRPNIYALVISVIAGMPLLLVYGI